MVSAKLQLFCPYRKLECEGWVDPCYCLYASLRCRACTISLIHSCSVPCIALTTQALATIMHLTMLFWCVTTDCGLWSNQPQVPCGYVHPYMYISAHHGLGAIGMGGAWSFSLPIGWCYSRVIHAIYFLRMGHGGCLCCCAIDWKIVMSFSLLSPQGRLMPVDSEGHYSFCFYTSFPHNYT
jgi:hypothetical protein